MPTEGWRKIKVSAAPGAPYAYVTTKKFLELFGLAGLRDLPGIEKLEDGGL